MKLLDPNAHKAVELMLRCMFRSGRSITPGYSFQITGRLGGAEIYFETSALLDAALYIRRHASPHLRSLAVDDLKQMLVSFMSEEIDPLVSEWWTLPERTPFYDVVGETTRSHLVEKMGGSAIFMPHEVLFLYPISVATVLLPFRSATFFFLAPNELASELARWYAPRDLQSNRHPPTPMHDGMRHVEVACWLGVRAPTLVLARRMRDTILGALALLPHPLERYQFSLASVPRGYMSFDRTATYHSGDPSTPALGEKVVLDRDDQAWLSALASMLPSQEKSDRKHALALQYFYRAWVRDEATRVAPLCGALDALFGDQDAATQAMVTAVGQHLGAGFNEQRAKRLAKLRAGVIHGGAPNIYEASVYHSYYVDYRQDPIRDLEVATASCLRRAIFDDRLQERPHTYADLIRRRTGAVV